jgi:hypothetical protein
MAVQERRGMARRGEVRYGKARQLWRGNAGRGMAVQGTVRQEYVMSIEVNEHFEWVQTENGIVRRQVVTAEVKR